VDPSNIPDHIDVDVTPLTIGHSLHVADLQLPAGVEVEEDPEQTVAVVSAPKAEEVVAAPVVEGAVVAPDVAPEPELIRKPKVGEEEGEESES
jgi:large subunit ribosomal protein L25